MLALALCGCASGGHWLRADSPLIAEPPAERADIVTFYALGDWGTGSDDQHRVAGLLAEDVRTIDAGRRHVPFGVALGDNIYEHGLPAGWERREVAQLMDKTFGAVYDSVRWNGRAITWHVVPGNHDHGVAGLRRTGWGDVVQQETWAEGSYRNWRYYPIAVDRDRIPDSNDSIEYSLLRAERLEDIALPQKLELDDALPLTIVAIDTQLLLRLHERGDDAALRRQDEQLTRLLAAAGDDWKIVIGHHPVRTRGQHGGHRSVRDWFLRPFPIVSFFYNFIDVLFPLSAQDTDHKHNRAFVARLLPILRDQGALYLAGHDHSLQLIELDAAWQVVSGSAAKQSGVGHGEDTHFASDVRGFARLDVTPSALWIRFLCLESKCEGDRAPSFRLSRPPASPP